MLLLIPLPLRGCPAIDFSIDVVDSDLLFVAPRVSSRVAE